MAYFVGLLTLLVIAFFTLSGDMSSPSKSIDSLKSSISSFINPKSDKEIVIEELSSNVDTIIALLDDTVPNILKFPNISDEDKANLAKIVEAANNTKAATTQVQTLESQNSGLLQTIVNNVSKLLSPDTTNNGSLPNPTYIPPQCKVVCDE